MKANIRSIKPTVFKENLSTLFVNFGLQRSSVIDLIISDFHKTERSCGRKEAIRRHKEFHNFLTRFYLDQKPVLTQLTWVKTDSCGFPRALRPFKGKLGVIDIRFALTVTSYYKLYRLPPSYDVNSITSPLKDPSRTERTIQMIEKKIPILLLRMGILPLPNETEFTLFVTNKASASGPRAMSFTNVQDLDSCIGAGYFGSLLRFIKETFGRRYLGEFTDLASKVVGLFPMLKNRNESISRLHFISEGGGKTRVITIRDYWSQLALKGLHDYVMRCLKRIPQDGTFSHNNLAKKFTKLTLKEGFYCYDLTNATDRLPVDLQVAVLKQLIGKQSAILWKKIMVEPTISNPRGGEVRYAVGQPMGILSSWAVFSLTHHIIVRYSALEIGVTNFEYGIIGDDICISDQRVAERYAKVMDDLGVEFSKEKSILSSPTNKVCEIAKRLFTNGFEISPVPPKVLVGATKDLSGLLEFLQVLHDRGYINLNDVTPGLETANLFSTFLRKNKEGDKDWVHAYLSFPFYNSLAPLSGLTKGVWKRWTYEEILHSSSVVSQRILEDKLQELRDQSFDLSSKLMNLDRTKEFLLGSPVIDLYAEFLKLRILKVQQDSNIKHGDAMVQAQVSGLELNPLHSMEVLEEILALPWPDQLVYFTKRANRVHERGKFIRMVLDHLENAPDDPEPSEEYMIFG